MSDTSVNQPSSPADSSPGFDAASFEATKGVILNLSMKLDELKNKQREFRERLKNLFENDTQLSTYEEQASEAAKAYKKRKKELSDSVEGKEVVAKIKEAGEEVRDIEESLTNHLLQYFQVTGTQSFDTPAGEEREFSLKARLLPVKEQ